MMAALGQVAEGIRRVHSQDTPRSEGSDQGTDVSSLGYIGGSAMSELGQSEARRGVSAASASSSLAALKDRQAKCMQATRERELLMKIYGLKNCNLLLQSPSGYHV
ncbi:unnamed protein product [Polarella glacialis]|uniref:Uncharacterized protein n=1 Tax=Polarella glacialis TaxID=89957 RepID=A0A813LV18_POLGL|nr:unnamed protein product [Polarella glacialis]